MSDEMKKAIEMQKKAELVNIKHIALCALLAEFGFTVARLMDITVFSYNTDGTRIFFSVSGEHFYRFRTTLDETGHPILHREEISLITRVNEKDELLVR